MFTEAVVGRGLELVALPAFRDVRGTLSFAQLRAPLDDPVGAVAFVRIPPGGALDARAAFVVALHGSAVVECGVSTVAAETPLVGVCPRTETHVHLASTGGATLLVVSAAHGSSLTSAPAVPVVDTTVDDCRRVPLPVECACGTSTIPAATPFPVRRIYWIYGVRSEEKRGAHAHRALWQSIHAPSGAFDLHLDDGRRRVSYHLDDPAVAVLVPPMMWRDLDGFTEDAVVTVLASELYDPSDYVRDYATFCGMKAAR